MKIVVLAKQVPDTRNVGKDAMKADGTVNRAVLPAIFNPDDLCALEMALEAKDRLKNAEVYIITMGPSRAAEIIRESIYRGADKGFLLTDRKFAGSDTLATSYAISQAVKQWQPDLIFCGLQAIDGDTAQVGPQTAEKLALPQITYAEELIEINDKNIVVKRRLERGVETVKSTLPALVTVHGSAPACRARNAKRVMQYKHARTASEMQEESNDYTNHTERPYLFIEEWSADFVKADDTFLGLTGSPTKVKKIDNVILAQKENKTLTCADSDVEQLMVELLESRVIG
ncbi:MAG: electron transfer flavoprotein subunit beta/FixA family protein [Bacteroidetes bacterium]|nr:electron transfer flavoprotein subunit beta/FixA family protein [Bacteroidota bacterium]MCL2302539.1 electron transfer flavoprotein subunit beta/FixA family protein [Lentimicrobiaceae bacterium]